MNIKELKEKRAVIGKRLHEINDGAQAQGRDLNTEERENWDAANKDWDDLTSEIKELEAGQERQSRLTQINDELKHINRLQRSDVSHKPTAEDRGDYPSDEEARSIAIRTWMKVQTNEAVDSKDVEISRRVGMNPYKMELDIKLPSTRSTAHERRALTTQTGSSGGFTVPEGFVAELEAALLQFGGVRQMARIIRTDSGNDLPWPTVNDTSNTGTLEGENDAVAATDVTFGATTFKAYKISSDLVRVPVELIEDSAFDMPSMLGQLLGERIGRGMNAYLTTGQGTTEPAGVVTGSTLGKTAAGTGAITADELFDLHGSVDPAYRSSPSFGWMLSDAARLIIAKLKDGEGRYLMDLTMGTMLGAPFVVNQQMAAVTTGLKTVLCGDFSRYIIREVNTLRLRRLVERYADNDQEGFVAFMRFDGSIINAGTNPIKHLIQA